MEQGRWNYVLPEYSAILSFIDSIFAELNMGLLIYHLEDPAEKSSLRLIYANREAANCTRDDLQRVVGKTIFEAFPRLAETDVAQIYLEVVNLKESRQLGIVAYHDPDIPPSEYSVKAFPMPNSCVGILFDKITDDRQAQDR